MDTDSKNKNGAKQNNEKPKAQTDHAPGHSITIAIIGGIFIFGGAICAALIGIFPDVVQGIVEWIRATPAPTIAPKLCEDVTAITWNEAISHSGEILTVIGPVVEANYVTSTSGEPTFLNIGKEFPDPERFTVVIWGDDRQKFPNDPEQFYRGKQICVRGLISEFQGSMQIEIDDPSQIEIK